MSSLNPQCEKVRALVLASPSTCRVISDCVSEMYAVRTTNDAVMALQTLSPTIIIASLGRSLETHLITNNNRKNEKESKLFKTAYKRQTTTPRVVFSWTASQSEQTKQLCFAIGADAVVSSFEELQAAIAILNFPSTTILSESKRMAKRTNKTLICLSVLERRYHRETQLLDLAGGIVTWRLKTHRYWTEILEQQIRKLRQPPPPPIVDAHQKELFKNDTIRMVHVSDTHNLHRRLRLSQEDLFLHTGDICGNYDRKTDLVRHFEDFLQWLEETVCPNFEQVVFIGGNHDTYLDETKTRSSDKHYHARQLLTGFLDRNPNAAYLNNSGIRYKGLLIYGSSACPCRVELLGKRFLSDGFERTRETRQQIWQKVPQDTDILLTHVPPAIFPYERRNTACKILAETIYQKKSVTRRSLPIIHAFGHDHDYFGVQKINAGSNTDKRTTLLLNGSQQLLLRDDMGGTPLVLHIPIVPMQCEKTHV